MVEILSLKTEDKQRLNSYALKRFNDWKDRILSKAPQLRQLSIEQLSADLSTYLNDNERVELDNCLDDVMRWLSGCMDTGDSYFPYAYDTQVIAPMFRVEYLIMKAFRAKEDEEEWNAACRAVNPPLSDAKMYFNDEEYGEFRKAAQQAIQAYTEKGEAYLSDGRSFDYCRYLGRIRNRKKKERELFLAKVGAEEFNRRLNEEKVRLKALLSSRRKDINSYFKKQVKDRRYTGQNFSRLLSKKEEQDFDETLVEISKKRVKELVSKDFHSFVASECRRSFFLLPSADYILEEVPCMAFTLDVFAIVETDVWLKPGQKEFNGYVFDFPLREGKESSSVKTKEFLGYYHLVLTPEEFGGWSFWQNIPLVLFKGVVSGETRPSGTVITSASNDEMTYEVEGFEEEVEIPTQFAEYLERIGSIDEMVGMGVMTEKVGRIIAAALGELEVRHKISQTREKARRKDSMKRRVFGLFDEGKRPSDSEVKALGIKPNTVYRYYQDWKKTRNSSQS